MSDLFLPADYTSADVPVNANNPDIIYLDLYKPKTVYYNMKATFNGRQLDKDVPLKVQLGYGHKPLNLNKIKDIQFVAAKPDGTGVQTMGEYNVFNPVGGLVYVTIPAATFSAPGTLYFNIRVITENDQLLSSNTCYFEVEANFARAVFNSGNYDSEIESAKKEALAKLEQFNNDFNDHMDTANNLAKGIENSNRVLANAVDENANAVRSGMAPTNGGANVFTAPNTFQQLLTLAGGLNIASGDFTANGTKVDFADLLKRLADVIDKVNHLFDGKQIGADADFNNLDNGISLVYVTEQTIAKGHNFPIIDNSKDNEKVSMYGLLLQAGNSKGKYPVAFQVYFNVSGTTDPAIYMRQKAGNGNGGWGDWSSWAVNK